MIETNKQIGLAFLTSIFIHVAVFSFFFANKLSPKEINADLMRQQAVPVQIVSSVQSHTNALKNEKASAIAKPKPGPPMTSNDGKETAKAPTEKTAEPQTLPPVAKIEPAAGRAPKAGQSKTIPLVNGASLVGRRVQPEYPKRSLQLNQEGIVYLHVLISPTGDRQQIKLFKPSKYALLNQAALKAVKKWTFDPNIVNGRGVQSWIEIPIEFKIK